MAVCRFENRRLHYTGLRFVSPQEHLFPRCFGTFSISSFPFHFLNENNLKIVSTWLPEKWPRFILCSGNTSLTLNCLRIQCHNYTKHDTETDTGCKKSQHLHMCHRKPRNGLIPDRKPNELQNMSRNIYDCIYFVISYAKA